MLIINFMIILIMFVGVLCTLAPRLHGTVIILAAAGIYAIIIGVNVFPLWVAVSLLLLTATAEVGVNGLRIALTKKFEVSRRYSVDTSVCHMAGIVAADALLGTLFGIAMWEMVVGKTLFPRSKVLIRLIFIAVLRFICGLIMTVIVIKYMMYIQ